MASVAGVYAKALFELGQSSGQLESMSKELKAFAEAFQSHPALGEILSGAGVDSAGRGAVLRGVASAIKVSDVVARLLDLLVKRGRASAIPEISRELESMIEAAQGIRSGQVRSAVELSEEELSVLGSALAKRVGGKVKLSQVIDPSLLGGMVATVAGKTFDASLRTQLERFKNELI